MPEIEGSSDPAFQDEVRSIMRDPAYGRDPALTARLDGLYKTKYGTATVELGEGISVTGREAKSNAPAGSPSKSPTVTIGDGITISGEDSSEDPPRFDPDKFGTNADERDKFIRDELRKDQEFAGDFDGNLHAAGAELGALFRDRPDWLKDLGRDVRRVYGPRGEMEVVKLGLRLARLRQQD